MNPRVSIIIGTYNRAHFIPEMLDSVIKQTYKLWECLIIDDGSTDNTRQIVEQFVEKDNRIKYFRRTEVYKKGLPGCRNMGIETAQGDLIVFFDDDDIAHPLLLELATKEITGNQVDFCRYQRNTFSGGFEEEFDMNRNYSSLHLGIGELENIITNELPFNSCQILWNKKCFHNSMFVEDLMYAEEWELYSRILSEGRIGVSIQKVLYYGRKHPESNTGEYLRDDKIRKASFLQAHLLVLENLGNKELLTPKLKQLFIRMGFFFKSKSLLKKALKFSKYSPMKKFKIQLGFILYPLLRPIFILKGKILGS